MHGETVKLRELGLNGKLHSLKCSDTIYNITYRKYN